MSKPNYREAVALDAPVLSGEERRVPRPARYVSWMQRLATQDKRTDLDVDIERDV